MDELRQCFLFIAAGIADLVPYGDGSDPDAAHCPECWWLWHPGTQRCPDCGYPKPLELHDGV
jgi:hypothetical protein